MDDMRKKTVSRARSTKEAPAAPTEIVVRRGALRRFDALKRKTADLPVIISWDRRLGERRSATDTAGDDRRKADRRQKPPFTWELAEFVVVAARTPAPEPTPAKPRPRRRAATRAR
jgi:hypothetical protein